MIFSFKVWQKTILFVLWCGILSSCDNNSVLNNLKVVNTDTNCTLVEDQSNTDCLFVINERLSNKDIHIRWGDSVFDVVSVAFIDEYRNTSLPYGYLESPITINTQNQSFIVIAEATHISINLNLLQDKYGDSYISLFDSNENLIANYTVRVNSFNDPPVFNGDLSGSEYFTDTPEYSYNFPQIPFGSVSGYVIGSISATDDSGRALAYDLSSFTTPEVRDLFDINTISGEISLRQTINNNIFTGIYKFDVVVIDGEGGRAEAGVSVEINPTINPTFAEDSYNFAPIAFGSPADREGVVLCASVDVGGGGTFSLSE